MGETTKVVSPSGSFDGWDLWLFIKGRKKIVVGALGYLCGLFIGDNHTVAVVSAGVADAGYALAEYYWKKYEERL